MATLTSFKSCANWVAWAHEIRNGAPTKIPYDPKTGAMAATDDPSTWATYAEAETWGRANGAAGTGIVLGEVGGKRIGGVDLDVCRDTASGEIEDWGQAVIDRLRTYVEVSPSEMGVKLYFFTDPNDASAIETLFAGQHGRVFKNGHGAGSRAPAIEIYRSNRYFAATGKVVGKVRHLRQVSVEDLDWLINTHGPEFASNGAPGNKPPDTSRSGKAFRAGAALKAAGASYVEMRDALLDHADPEIAEWAHEKGLLNSERELKRIYNRAAAGGEGVRLQDFVAYMQTNDYIFMPSGDMWPGGRVNSRIPPIPLISRNGKPVIDADTGEQLTMKASAWLAKYAPVEQMTWAPGMPPLVRDRLISDGGWIDRRRVTVFNLYRPPTLVHGDPAKAGPWIKHVRMVYPDEAEHIIRFLAHRVQRPAEKINHGLVLGGAPGIGKDTLLEPVKHAVGAWNFVEVSPPQMLGRFNGYLKSIVLRISETKDMGEFDRFKFYDHLKVILAAPPDVLRVDEKNRREHDVFNVCGVVMTTNYKVNGIYLPADDRRHYVAWSDKVIGDFTEAYWRGLWSWYEREGIGHVAAYLATLDLAGFNPKAPPPKTEAFWAIVDANRAPEDAELADVIESLGEYNPLGSNERPGALTLDMIIAAASLDLAGWLRERKNRRMIPYRLEQCGYAPVRNPGADDGLYVIDGKRQVVYARSQLTIRDRFEAVDALLKNLAAIRMKTRKSEAY